jgi:hypothetical protein
MIILWEHYSNYIKNLIYCLGQFGIFAYVMFRLVQNRLGNFDYFFSKNLGRGDKLLGEHTSFLGLATGPLLSSAYDDASNLSGYKQLGTWLVAEKNPTNNKKWEQKHKESLTG